ncbi:hypothetical protein [Streptomyces sp. NBC_01363]|uniref:hypothetical protein n=1 Tax=Streptomyces sp. NBC_01363 TaxID=2903840 RepID=UPI002256D43F|nr:hypothetical protein [Streptomyces sp. NBC_01363]MCX4733903.1 hypothetical protein [Streptomyces sp. NBC_01363]
MTTRSASPAGPAAPRPPDAPDVSALLGDWVNTDQGSSKGALRLNVTWHENGLFVRAIGTGSPQPRDWGEVSAVVYTAPGTPSAAWSFSAIYNFGCLRTVLCAYHKTGILVATTSNIFSDGGGRADHWARSFFHRAVGRA